MRRDAAGRRIALLLEYDGTAYGGSQYQKNAPTVQGALERALSRLTGEPIRVTMAGRTDAGVHAIGQVATFLTAARHREGTLKRALNALLPVDIAVRAATGVPRVFNPRRDAVWRWYRYTLHLGDQKPALHRRTAWHPGRQLDLEVMRSAASELVGTHDFASFAPASEARKGSTTRNVTEARWTRCGELARFDIEANAYLAHMVRRIVGTLGEVGSGRMSVEEFGKLVSEPEPGAAGRTAPARGLCLMKVRYEGGLFDGEQDEHI